MNKRLATNPPLATDLCIPDVEAHVWEDGRLYLYGSFDLAGNQAWCSGIHHVYSTDDLINWVDHGVAFSAADIKWTDADILYAPECACYKGMYYLYYCLPGGQCGVAKSDKPYGPFADMGQIKGIHGIDPAVLVDDDGQAYLYWGQFDDVRVAKLRDNMMEIDPETVTQPLSVAEHEFHEGSSVRKCNGKYYFVFTDTHRHGNRATSQGYAVSDNPMSGFVYKNVLVDNFGCDPGTWNNHGSIECFKGQWYIFYHRATHNSQYSRQLWIEPLQMDKNGDFAEVKMSSSGAAWTLPATETIMGCQACEVTGGAYIAAEAGSAHAFALCGIRDGSTATWRHIAFGGEERFSVKMKTGAAGRVELYLDGWYRETMKVAASEDYTVFTAPVEALRGVHTVELKFFGAFGNAVLDELTFAQMKYFCTENQRKGTCYHEFQKGHFDRERFGSFDFWKDDSLLLHDDVLEETQLWKLFSAVLEGYDPLGSVEVTPLQWDAVCREARRAGGVWQEAIEEASPWADATFREHAVFTILGI